MIVLVLLSSTATADVGLWEKLRHDPNMVVLMRNAESGGNRDGTNMLVWDSSGNCVGESILTEEGRAQARAVGAAFSAHDINPVVISSPMCRCTQTAQIAFGKFIADPDLRQRPVEDTTGQEAFLAAAGALLAKHRGTSPIVFVNHRPNIDALTLELIGIGELLVGKILDDGEIEVLGRIPVQE